MQRWSGYERMAHHVAPANARMVDLVPNGPGRLLDIGTGRGHGVAPALERRWHPVGIDLDPGQLDAAARTGMPVVRGDATALPFESASFDAAVSNFALIFAADPNRAISEARRCVRPGGAVGFTAWAPRGWPGACRDIVASHLDLTVPAFPTVLGTADGAAASLIRNNLEISALEHGTLRWRFDDVDDAVDTLTSAAGGLRMLRRRAEEAGAWEPARRGLRSELASRCFAAGAGIALDDEYIVAIGTV